MLREQSWLEDTTLFLKLSMEIIQTKSAASAFLRYCLGSMAVFFVGVK